MDALVLYCTNGIACYCAMASAIVLDAQWKRKDLENVARVELIHHLIPVALSVRGNLILLDGDFTLSSTRICVRD